ncbi:MAG: molybdopterin-dependent oxidoreductase, partial [Dehalococcoidia bacterium]|nr:molybdopterin-dependent oxidoreductase [Dehalococcoidia bacterium]
LAGLPFVPFDLFDWVSRVTPGSILTVLIDAMVRIIVGLHLGEISHAAKVMEQSIAIGAMAALSMLFGAVIAYLVRRSSWSTRRIGLVAGSVLFLIVLIVETFRGFPDNPWLGVPWLALLITGWGLLLAGWIDRVVHPTTTPADGEVYRASRRDFLLKIAGGSVAMAAAAWGFGWLLQQQRLGSGAADQPLSEAAPGPAVVPPSPTPQATPAGGQIEPVPGTRPEVTENESFYRIDINLISPSVNQTSWRLTIKGLFDNPRSLSLSDLMAYPSETQPVTLSCISNPIGGDLIGNAYWTGLRLVDLLKNLGLRPEAKALQIQATDGFYESVTMADLLDQRTLLVYGMNGKTLPMQHGFPLRIVIPNHYGMKQPKWMTSIEATEGSGRGYWVERGWSQEARPQVLSIIDTIAKDRVAGGRIPIGGIAWAGDRGIEIVEVQVDNGPWEPAELRAPPLGLLTWVQWRYDWPRVAGRHTFRARATDGKGRPQSRQPTDPYPNGATGYHSITVTI